MTTARLKKRGTVALIIYFLLISAVCAPLAFLAGRAQGRIGAQAGADMSQNEPDLRAEYAALYRARRAGAGCGGETDPDTARRAVWEITCHPYAGGAGGLGGARSAGAGPDHASAAAARPKTANDASRKRGPLDDVMVAALAAGAEPATGDAGAGNPGSPLSLALAPGAGVISGPGYGGHTMSGGFGGGLFGGPNAPGGLPGNIIPNISTDVNNPAPPPPTVVTPAPAALPLLLTGLAGLFAAARRRKRG